MDKLTVATLIEISGKSSLAVEAATTASRCSDKDRFELISELMHKSEMILDNGLADKDALRSIYVALMVIAADGLADCTSPEDAVSEILFRINHTLASFGLDPVEEYEA